MKKNFNDPELYDRVFRPKRWPIVLMAVIFGVLLLATLAFLLCGNKPRAEVFKLLSLFGGFFLVSALCAWLYPKRLLAGINSDGVYARGYGLVFWDEIKEFKIKKNGQGQKFILIVLHNPEAFFSRNPKRSWLHNLMFGKTVVIAQQSLPVKAKEFIAILQECIQRFTQT